ncbi:unnamed protein product [Cuscuta europaea]|uniref:CST complex subunit CTC1 n=1 Tax=Cuscuta europaea TaxID=41803 RepID=A0A9P0YGZ5_CUSEU|nr:unnamed protein product [Cuscuta europaea]
MGEETVQILKLSELIGRSRPLTGAFSLISSPSISLSGPARNSGVLDEPDKGFHPDTATPTQKVLKSLTFQAVLTGTLTLPTHNDDSSSKCACFQFSDGSATVCCDILTFDLKILGKKIKISAWNFIPLGSNSGFLEIIRWEFLEPPSFLDTFSLFQVSSTNSAGPAKAQHFLTGEVESISPVSVIPCAGSTTSESNCLKSLRGFLAKILVCECNLCWCTHSTIQLRKSNGDSICHCFQRPVVLYFCGPASHWHPVMTRLVGRLVSLSGLKKKSVSIGKGISQLMYVTAEKSSIRISTLPDQFISIPKFDVRGNGKCGSYNGIVTAIYMQGMIVELDQEVMLLLTNRDIIVPHSLRVGAIVSLRNVHFVNPKFSWAKFLILGSCIKTSVSVKSFSLLETGAYTRPRHQSLFRKFIDSLTFVARLWALLVIATFRRKFTGILSTKEIIGSKNKKGLAQLYATSRLPKSVFLSQHGPFWAFCKHDTCACSSEVNYFQPSLVVPFSNLVYYCESIWIEVLLDQERVNIMGPKDQYKSISCGIIDYMQFIKRIVHSDEIGISLVGNLKISESSGRLQLVDATGTIEITPNFSMNWNFQSIYEVKRFTLAMQGLPEKMDNFYLPRDEPFSCRSIFTSGPQMQKINISLHFSYNVADKESIKHPISENINMKETFQELERGRFHLLLIKHKFPILQKYQGHHGISSKLSVFVEALVLPWDLHISESDEDNLTDIMIDHEKYLSGTLPHASPGKCNDSSCISEFFCLVTGRRDNSHCKGKLQCHHAGVMFGCSQPDMKKALLEFTYDAFSVYEALRIGCYYMIKHNEADMLCASASHSKVLLNFRTHIWSLSFSTSVVSPESFPQHETQFDITLFLSSDFNMPKSGLIGPHVSSEEEMETKFCNEEKVSSSVLPSGTRYSDYHLPEGNLIHLRGRVCVVHPLDDNLHHGAPLHSVLFEEACICIHLMVGQKMVRIYGAIHKNACPAGFGKGVSATFHRILVLSGQDGFMMIPSSYISVHSDDISYYAPAAEDSLSLDPCSNVPRALIYETMHCSKNQPLEFRCRVVAVYVLIMENRDIMYSYQRAKSKFSSSSFDYITLAGFILDDGSSSCCCWVTNEHAAALLGLSHPKVYCESHEKIWSRSRKSRKEKNCSLVGSHLKDVIKRHHGRVVVKNLGSTFDPSAQELVFSVNLDTVMSTSDEHFLRKVILNACSNNTWNVVVRLVDSEESKELVKHLREVDMLLPQMKNVWALGVDRVEALAEARYIIQGLVGSS